MHRLKRIEVVETSLAGWKPAVLPLNYIRMGTENITNTTKNQNKWLSNEVSVHTASVN